MDGLMFRSDLMKGMRILVAGGGTGIGEAMADAYASLGASVYLVGRRLEVVEATAARISADTGSYAKGFACDVRDPEQVAELIDKCWKDGGPIQGLMNSAAGNFISRTEDLSPNAFNAITDIAFRGAFYLTQAIGKRWIDEGIKGTVISILATWVYNGGPFAVPAAMSKGGIDIMSKSLSSEWGKYGIRLHTINPGYFSTEGSDSRLQPLMDHGWRPDNLVGRLGDLRELAQAGVFLMAPGMDFMTGQMIDVDGGAYLSNGGNFMALSSVDDAGWKQIKDHARGATDAQKEQRTV